MNKPLSPMRVRAGRSKDNTALVLECCESTGKKSVLALRRRALEALMMVIAKHEPLIVGSADEAAGGDVDESLDSQTVTTAGLLGTAQTPTLGNANSIPRRARKRLARFVSSSA